MHWIGSRAKGFTFAASIRCITGAFAVNDVRRNGQNRLRVDRVAIRGMLSQFAHEHRDNGRCELVYAIVIVAEFWEIAFGLVINDQSRLVSDHFYARVANRRLNAASLF